MTRHRERRVAFKTLGCKLNQYDSEELRESFERRGYVMVPFEQPADVYVINSCTVTSRADKDARKLARNAKRRRPEALIVVTGCYATTQPEELASIAEVDLVAGLSERARLAEMVDEALDDRPAVSEAMQEGDWPLIGRFAAHTRAFVKVQEGCDARCAYCVVPLARGPSRSRPLPEALEQVARFAHAGHREVVLIGVHLGMYGRDLSPPCTLTELIRGCLDVEGLGRVRLSSIEPREVTEELVDLLACRAPAVCRHLHIPLQSGDDEVLRRMGRPYDARFCAELASRLVRAIPGVAIGADVMVGFPGEAEEAFANTLALVQRSPVAYLHVFSYSRRPGTRAADMPDHVRPDVKKERSRALRELSERKWAEFLQAQIGEQLQVIVEQGGGGEVAGHSDNYVEVKLPGCRAGRGELVRAAITDVEDDHVVGRIG